MSEQMDPHREGTAVFSSANNEELLRATQTEPRPEEHPETEAPSPERRQLGRESLTVTYLNTSFSGAFEDPNELDSLLLNQVQLAHGVRTTRENAIFGFSEVTHNQRPAARAALKERGYQVIEPPEDSHLDLIWAVSPALEIESTDVHHFPRTGVRRVASRSGNDHYRHVGIQDITIVTPQLNRIRLSQERLSPWVVEPVRRLQLKDTKEVLASEFSRDRDDANDVLLTLNGGDMNHMGPLRGPDSRLWDKLRGEEGWEPMLEPGTATHSSANKYRRSERIFRALGRKSDETQLDAVYARPRSGVNLVNAASSEDAELSAGQIGFTSRTLQVRGTDHYAVETTFSLPVGTVHA